LIFTIKQMFDYRLLFNNLLWVHEEGAVGSLIALG